MEGVEAQGRYGVPGEPSEGDGGLLVVVSEGHGVVAVPVGDPDHAGEDDVPPAPVVADEALGVHLGVVDEAGGVPEGQEVAPDLVAVSDPSRPLGEAPRGSWVMRASREMARSWWPVRAATWVQAWRLSDLWVSLWARKSGSWGW